MAVKITPEIKEIIDSALATMTPVVIAYADEKGQPILSFRGSVHIHGDDQLAWWVRKPEGRMITTLASHPRVSLMYRNAETRAMYQFQGRARIVSADPERSRVYDESAKPERDADKDKLGVGVVVDLDRVEGFAGFGPNGPISRVAMEREG